MDKSLKEFTLPVLLEMLKDRGYCGITDVDTETMYVSRTFQSESNEYVMLIKFVEQEKVSVEKVRQIINHATSMGLSKCIVVFTNHASSQVKTFLKDSDINLDLEIFDKYELGFNVTKHVLVPKHTLLSCDEKKELLKKYKQKNLPQIRITDPVSKYYGAKVGDIFYISRKMGMTYRVVC